MTTAGRVPILWPWDASAGFPHFCLRLVYSAFMTVVTGVT